MPLVKVQEEPKSENGVHLFYESFGDASDPCVLLIMGLNAQMLIWHEAFCKALAARGFFVIRFDNRDVGLSTKLEAGGVPSVCSLLCIPNCCAATPAYSLDDMASDCVGLLDALKIEKAHIVGQSMGGMIAQLVAANHPQRTLSLTSVYSSPGMANPEPTLKIKLAMAKQPKDKTREAFVENMREMAKLCFIPEQHWDQASTDELNGQVFDRSTYADGGFRQANALLRQKSRLEALKTIKCPTLVIHGKADVVVPFPNAEATVKAIPGARLLVIDDMGHSILPAHYDAVCGAFVEISTALATTSSERIAAHDGAAPA
jgi:pimeloyl-ACP methyl ester carboxylesterase